MKTLLVLLLVLAAILVGGGFLLPTTYAVERTATIDANPDAIAPYLQDLKKWQDWTIWNSKDNPELETSYAGETAGPGAKMTWTEGDVGTGSLEIAEVGAHGGIVYDLRMAYDMFGDSTGKGTITLEPADGKTEVRWTDEMTSDSFVGRWMGVFADMAVGGMLETNLDNLKARVEGTEE